MTKHRAPLSTEQALDRIASQLLGGIDEMAQEIGRAPRTIRNWRDPDTPEDVPIGCAVALDLAFMRAGGVGAPLREAYDYQLEQAELVAFADRICLGKHAVDVIREAGEAHAAIVLAAQPGATVADRRRAETEVSEALDTLKRALPLLAQEPEAHERGPPAAD